jgi:hypothetical protein
MTIKEYFKKQIENCFLYTKVPTDTLLKSILKEHFGEIATLQELNENYALVQFNFDNVIVIDFKMEIVQGQSFAKFFNIE